MNRAITLGNPCAVAWCYYGLVPRLVAEPSTTDAIVHPPHIASASWYSAPAVALTHSFSTKFKVSTCADDAIFTTHVLADHQPSHMALGSAGLCEPR